MLCINITFVSLAEGELEEDSKFSLTVEEKEWLNKHDTVVLAFDEDYAPYSFKNSDGKYVGIAVDFAAEVFGRAGIAYEIYPQGQWSKLYDGALNGEVDVIATLNKRAEREASFLFTDPYISIAQYVITHESDTSIVDKDDLNGKKVALVENTQYPVSYWRNIAT